MEHIKIILANRLDVEEWRAFKPLERLSNTVTDSELNECHKMICPDINLVDFVTSYREASYTSEVAEKKMSIQLLKFLLLNEAWKPLSISMVCIKWYIDLLLNILIIIVIHYFFNHIYTFKL